MILKEMRDNKMDMKKGFKAADPNETGRLDVM